MNNGYDFYRDVISAMQWKCAFFKQASEKSGFCFEIIDANSEFLRSFNLNPEKKSGIIIDKSSGKTSPEIKILLDFASDILSSNEFKTMPYPDSADLTIAGFPVDIGTLVMVLKYNSALNTGKHPAEGSDQIYRSLFFNSQSVMLVIDPDKFDIVDANPAALRFYGYTLEEIKKLKITDINTATKEKIKEEMDRAKTLSRYYFQFVHRLSSGEMRPVEVFSGPVDFGSRKVLFSIIHDISERSKAEDQLRESEESYRTLARNLPGSVYRLYLDGSSEVQFFNDYHEKLTGYNSGELGSGTVSPLEKLVFPEQRQQTVDIISSALRDRLPFEIEYRILKKDKSLAFCSEHGRPIFGKNGEPLYIDGVIYDLTEKKRVEDERRRLESRIQQAQKLDSLGILAGGIAHDFNNLLTAILGNIDLAMVEVSPASTAAAHLSEAVKASREAADLIRQMLAYSGKGSLFIQPISIDEIIKYMTQMLKVSIHKKIALKYNFSADMPIIDADASQIRQVIMNFVINASEAIGDNNGIISISTGVMYLDRRYLSEVLLNELVDEGDYVFMEVSDTGSGMDEFFISKIFDPFFSTKFTGRGLGLAAVLGIVRGHKGAIKVYSEKGKGSTFKVFFPKSKITVSQAEVAQKNGIYRGSGTILLVDDEESVRNVCESMLKHLGYSVIIAGDGKKAIELYKENIKTISAVILDMTMPNMNGEEAFREIRTINKDAVVLISSGYNENEVGARFVGKGVSGFIQKPFVVSTLSFKLKQCLDRDKLA